MSPWHSSTSRGSWRSRSPPAHCGGSASSPGSSAVPEAPQELAGFQKVLLTAGQTSHVTFTLNARSFSHWDTASHGWKVTGGTYRILLGGSSRGAPLTGTVRLPAS